MAAESVSFELDEMLSSFLKAYRLTEPLSCEATRRVAEMKFKVLSERPIPYGDAEALIKNIRSLGYSNLEVEGNIELIFARYCMREGHIQQAKNVLSRLQEKLSSTSDPSDATLVQYLNGAVGELLAQLNQRPR